MFVSNHEYYSPAGFHASAINFLDSITYAAYTYNRIIFAPK